MEGIYSAWKVEQIYDNTYSWTLKSNNIKVGVNNMIVWEGRKCAALSYSSAIIKILNFWITFINSDEADCLLYTFIMSYPISPVHTNII